jgi:DNA ligase (NAD+)
MVAGVVNKSEVSDDLLNEIVFMAVEARIHDGDFDYPKDTNDFLKVNGFNSTYPAFTVTFTRDTFQKVYFQMKNYRENVSHFQLDGFVIKGPESSRKSLGDSGHHPNWAIAIKFPPVPAITKVIEIENRVATSGEAIPRICLEAVELDGTTVRHTAGYNWGYIIEKGLFPGAEVEIVKSGDIIPIITKVLKPNFIGTLPTNCQCGSPLSMEGIHLMCISDDCIVKARKKFIIGIGRYEMKHWGGTTRSNIFDAGFDSVWKIFDPAMFNKTTLIATGYFKEGRTLDKLFESLEKIEKVTLPQVIVSLGFDGVGRTASRQVAKMIRGKEYSFKGLEKKKLEGFLINEPKRNKVENLVKTLEYFGIKVEEEIELTDGIGYEMTGSPKASEYPVKRDLEKFLISKGYIHKALNKGAKVLLTDSLNSTKSKMAAARKAGIEIIEYTEFINKLNAPIKED